MTGLGISSELHAHLSFVESRFQSDAFQQSWPATPMGIRMYILGADNTLHRNGMFRAGSVSLFLSTRRRSLCIVIGQRMTSGDNVTVASFGWRSDGGTEQMKRSFSDSTSVIRTSGRQRIWNGHDGVEWWHGWNCGIRAMAFGG